MAAGVKICGITTQAGMDAAIAAGADWVGLNFFPASPRFVNPAQAAALIRPVPPLRVGLFVKPDDAAIAAALAAVKLDMLQIYAEPPRAAAIGARFGLPILLPVGVSAREELPGECPPGIAALLIEAKPPAGATRPGGNAAVFDWSILSGWRAPCPWMLAGGLTPANVAAAIRATAAPAVDVASGVEFAPGIKDPALVAAFVAAARAA
jgi:phosphoribosylanthranilate isomerase